MGDSFFWIKAAKVPRLPRLALDPSPFCSWPGYYWGLIPGSRGTVKGGEQARLEEGALKRGWRSKWRPWCESLPPSEPL